MPAELKSEKNTNTLKRALRANPNDPFAWYALGVSNYGKNQMDEALQCFTKAEQVKQGFSAANYYYIGVLQQYMGRIDEAKQSFEKAAGLKAINVVDKKARALAQKMLVASEDFVGDVFE
ncbi:unnamed protein product [Auanema sp. JU1783]|nr:unnamed protein product [Auanema sp. JU1783]